MTVSTTTSSKIRSTGPWPGFVRRFWMQLQAAQRRRIRRRTLTLTGDTCKLYEHNPFRVLGLTPEETTTRNLMQRRDEILTLLAAGLPVSEQLDDFQCVCLDDATTIDEAAVHRAVAQLQDEPGRLSEALSWFHLAGEQDDVLNSLANGDLDAAAAVWEHHRSNGSAPETRARSLWNLAVLTHARALDQEPLTAAGQRLGVPDLWAASLRLWSEVHDSPECWNRFGRQIARARDPRIHGRTSESLRGELLERILGVHLALAAEAVDQGFLAYAREHLRLVAESGFPDAAKEATLDAFFAPRLTHLRQRMLAFFENSTHATNLDEFDEVRRIYQGVHATFSALDAEARLAPLLREVTSRACASLKEDLRRTSDAVDHEIGIFLAESNALVARWNLQMNLYNRLPFGADALAKDALVSTYNAYQETSAGLARAKSDLKRLKSTARRLQPVREFMRGLAAIGGPEAESKLWAHIEDVQELTQQATKNYDTAASLSAQLLNNMRGNLS